MTKIVNRRFSGANQGWKYTAVCSLCGLGIRSDSKTMLCVKCRAKCPTCGKEKDIRAKECDRCGRSRKAVEQWRNPAVSTRMQARLKATHAQRRVTFDQLTLKSFHARPGDGRFCAMYWDGDKKRYIYRYQWVWILANGPIPDRHHIHHENGNCTDDRIENLRCLEAEDHYDLHRKNPRSYD